jgi:RNA polymerase sigma factor (sigma-70 family)
MTLDSRSTAQRSLHALLNGGALGARTDVELLDLFRTRRDETSDEAFRVLVERHGALVHSVCRRVLGPSSDCDDAFQATFLVLIRNARSIRKGDSLGAWLHGVALRVARRARDQSRRRRSIFRSEDHQALAQRPGRVSSSADASAAIHEEIDRLPARLRDPVILCCLEGRTYDEAARALGLKESSLRGRLHRGRKTLEGRLKARGDCGPGLLGDSSVVFAPASKLVDAVLRLATRSNGSPASAFAQAGPSVSSLAKGVTLAMFVSSFKTAAVVVTLAGSCIVGAVVAAQQGSTTPAPNGPTAPQAARNRSSLAEVVATPRPLTNAEKEERKRAILKALQEGFRSELPPHMTLEDLLKTIKKDTARDGYPGIPIYVSPMGLSEADATLRSEVDSGWKGSMGSALSTSLRLLKLDYFIKDGFLMIESRHYVLQERLDMLEEKVDRILRAIESPKSND